MSSRQFPLQAFSESLNQINVQTNLIGGQLEVIYQVQLSSFLDLWDKDDAVLKRKIGLWEGTCFEVFIQNKKNQEYIEFNFSGTGFWNVFYFKNRDQKIQEYKDLKITKHRFITEPKKRTFQFSFDLAQLPFTSDPNEISVGLTSILVNEDQEKEYFAIKHCGEKPDFHNPESFVSL